MFTSKKYKPISLLISFKEAVEIIKEEAVKQIEPNQLELFVEANIYLLFAFYNVTNTLNGMNILSAVNILDNVSEDIFSNKSEEVNKIIDKSIKDSVLVPLGLNEEGTDDVINSLINIKKCNNFNYIFVIDIDRLKK